jgi:hypothetical protein
LASPLSFLLLRMLRNAPARIHIVAPQAGRAKTVRMTLQYAAQLKLLLFALRALVDAVHRELFAVMADAAIQLVRLRTKSTLDS